VAVFGYARVSTARQANEGESLDVQRRMIEGYAHMHGLTLDQIVVEEGVSGSVPLNDRPAGGALLTKLKAGDIVIAAKLDRCFRSALDALNVVEQLKTRGVKLHLLDLGGDIAGNGLSKLFLTIAAAFGGGLRRSRAGPHPGAHHDCEAGSEGAWALSRQGAVRLPCRRGRHSHRA